MNKSREISNLAKSLVAAQKELHDPATSKVFISIFSILNKYGIAILQESRCSDNGNIIETVLLHESGEFIRSLSSESKNKEPTKSILYYM